MTVPDLLPGQSGLPVSDPTNSYWLRDPSPALLGHRTTRTLPPVADVVIIGSGITGAFAAHFLLDADPTCSVVMLEAREACWGATGRNGGHCQPNVYASPPSHARFELSVFRFLEAFARDNGVPCDWVSASGGGVHVLMTPDLVRAATEHLDDLAETDPDLAHLAYLVLPGGGDFPVEVERRGGPGGGRDVGKEEDPHHYHPTLPSLRVPDALGAVVQRHAASLWPYRLVAWVLEDLLVRFAVPAAAEGACEGSSAAAETAGWFNLQTWTPATALQRLTYFPSSSTTTADPSSSSNPAAAKWIVHTPRGQVAARRGVILATNGYTSALLPGFRDLIVPVRGQMSALLPPYDRHHTGTQTQAQAQADRLRLRSTYVFLGHGGRTRPSRDDYLVQRPVAPSGGGGELMFGGGRVQGRGGGLGRWDDGVVDADVAKYLRGELAREMDLRPGGGRDDDDDDDDDDDYSSAAPASTTTTDLDAEAAAAASAAPPPPSLRATHEWTGIMGYSRDEMPWVGPVPSGLGLAPASALDGARTLAHHAAEAEGLYVCAGYTGHGMPNAALCARAVANMLLRGVTRVEEGEDGLGSGTEGGGGVAARADALAEELQLPADFLVTPRRVGRARRGDVEVSVWSCKEVMVGGGEGLGWGVCDVCQRGDVEAGVEGAVAGLAIQ